MSRKLCYLCDIKRDFCIALHRLPKEPNIRSAWMSFCNLDENKDDVSNLQICSSHFKPDDFLEPRAKLLGGTLRLKHGRIPSILTPGRQSSLASERGNSLTFEQASIVISEQNIKVVEGVKFHRPEVTEDYQKTPEEQKQSRFLCKISTPDVTTLRPAKTKLCHAREKLAQQSKQIKILKQMNRRLKNRTVSLKDLVKYLKKKNFILENAVDRMLVRNSLDMEEAVESLRNVDHFMIGDLNKDIKQECFPDSEFQHLDENEMVTPEYVSVKTELVETESCSDVKDKCEDDVKEKCFYNCGSWVTEVKSENRVDETNCTITSEGIKSDDGVNSETLELPSDSSTGHGETGTDTPADISNENVPNKCDQHVPVHRDMSDIQMYRCTTCNYETRYKNDLTHLDPSETEHTMVPKSLSGISMLTCGVCGYETKKKPVLKMHMSIHRDPSKVQMYKCTVCDHKTKYKHHLNTHMLTHLDSSKKKMFKCDLCDYTAHWERKVKYHRLVHKDVPETDMHKCDNCDFKTKWKQNLKEHEIVHKDPSQVELYKCTTCSYTTKNKRYFKRHEARHSKDTGYECKLCDYTSNEKEAFECHSSIHKKSAIIKTYTCDVCGFETKRKAYLKKHAITHKDSSEVEMYKCTICSFETKHKHYIKVHISKHLSRTENKL